MSFLSTRSAKGLVREGIFDAVKIGATENYLSAFGIFLGGTPLQIGTLATLPPLVGAIVQSIGSRINESVRSRRSVVVRLMRLQALMLVPIAVIPFLFGFGSSAVFALIAAVILYQVTIGLLAPIWNSLVGDILPPLSRGEFFGLRSRWIAIITFSAVIVAGQTIHAFAKFGLEVWGFVIVFLVSCFARLFSAQSFKCVDDLPGHVPEGAKFTFWQFISRARYSNFVKFVFFVSSMNFAASLSGAYIGMYMLRDLQFSYSSYTVALGAAVLSQFIVMQAWGSLSDRFGNRTILKVCGTMIAFNPFLWLVSSNLLYVIFLQFYAGIFWAGFNLCAANFVFDAVTPPKRARCIAYQGIINGCLVFLGSIGAGMIIKIVPSAWLDSFGLWVPSSQFLTLFWLSAILRLAVMSFLFPSFREVREVEVMPKHHLVPRIILRLAKKSRFLR